MKKISLSLLFLLLAFILPAQEATLIDHKALYFKLEDKIDPIDFIVVDTTLTEKKAVFLFCQGSLPIPLFIRLEDQRLFMQAGGIGNFDLERIEQIEMLDMSGRIIRRQGNINNTTYQLECGSLAPGLYILKVRIDGNDITQKVMFEYTR